MASTSAVSMALPLTRASQNRLPDSDSFLKPLPVKPSMGMASTRPNGRLEVRASSYSSFMVKDVSGLTSVALTTLMAIPEVAQAAAAAGVTPSLKNFLLSIVAGAVVAAAIAGAVVGVAKFDPVKRS